MHLACVTLRMTMEEALAAATINAAAALGVSDKCGSLEEGKMADMLIPECFKVYGEGEDKFNEEQNLYYGLAVA